jgi:hypothetical protein
MLAEKYGPFMDLQKLADLLRLEKRSLYQQIYLGTLEVPYMKRGKKYLFPTKETTEYLEDQILR